MKRLFARNDAFITSFAKSGSTVPEEVPGFDGRLHATLCVSKLVPTSAEISRLKCLESREIAWTARTLRPAISGIVNQISRGNVKQPAGGVWRTHTAVWKTALLQ